MTVSTGRRVWAVVAGVLFIVVITTLIDLLLHQVEVFPAMDVPLDDRLSVIALAYRIPINIAGAYLTARLAPVDPMKHAILLGKVGTVLGLVGVIGTWNAGLGPHWYPISLAVLAIPLCWVGGKLYVQRAQSRP